MLTESQDNHKYYHLKQYIPGSSMVKAIYTSQDGDNLIFHFVNFPREKYAEAFHFLNEKVTIQAYLCHVI